MTNSSRLKLIEHSLPLDAINSACETEKQIKVGKHTSIHQWFAPRPLAANRAMIFAQLVDDPSAWPEKFSTEEDQAKERRRLHKIIEDMVEWPKSDKKSQERFECAIEAARFEIARSVAWGLGETPPDPKKPQMIIDYLQEKGPPVYDPFCGGGSIPLEAQRLGLRAYGSDLNPVAVLITKALIEFPPKFSGLPPVHPDVVKDEDLLGRQWKGAQGLAEDVRRYAQWMRDEAEKKIGHLYPQAELDDGTKATVIAWLWARTVASPDPKQKGRHVPLVSSFILSSKKGKEVIVLPVKDERAKDGWRFTVKTKAVAPAELEKAKTGTKASRGSNFTCTLSGAAIDASYVKKESKSAGLGCRLMAIVAEGTRSRTYLEPTAHQESTAEIECPAVPEIEQSLPKNPRWFSPPDYGMPLYKDLFTSRQLTALTTFSDLIKAAREKVFQHATVAFAPSERKGDIKPLAEGGVGAAAYADAVATYLAFCLDRACQCQSTLNRWRGDIQKIEAAFEKQALPMIWDFGEANIFANSTGSWIAAQKYPMMALERWGATLPGIVTAVDAPKNNYEYKNVVFATDPPYYDNIGYADLSDFFYVWLRRSLKGIHPDLFRRLTTPKTEELIATPYRHKDKEAAKDHFIAGISASFQAMNRASNFEYPITAYYAFKQAELKSDGLLSPGWVAFLQALVSAGQRIDGTWPVRSEQSSRMISQGTNALASSVVLVCRARPDDAAMISRRDFIRELKLVMRRSIRDHQEAGVPLPDRRQAAIGPGIGVFSKYKAVREVDDSEMTVATALALINKEIDEVLNEGTEALDAETRFALEWHGIHGFKKVERGAGQANDMLLGFNLSIPRMNNSGLFDANRGDAKLLTRDEMFSKEPNWRPATDETFTVWEMAQHLTRVFHAEDGGVDKAGRMLAEYRRCAPDVLLLAERLFERATANGQAEEALVWNQLQVAWPEIERAADRAEEAGIGPAQTQGKLL